MNTANLLQIADAALRQNLAIFAMAVVLAVAVTAQIFAESSSRMKLARIVSK